jgi:serine/threonine-protein kinase
MTEPEPGTLVAGTYRLTEPIASGGMGSVWRAVNTHLDAPVAVKFMHAALLDDDETSERFAREAKAAAKIRSPHVVHIHDYGIDDALGMPFIVMEALEGEDLARRLKRLGRLPLPEALRICQQACRGLHRAHEAGILHRDLKPANIFLCERDEDMVKILDFGIAKQTRLGHDVHGDDLTATGQILGSPHYMSPEQVRSQPLDPRSDLWSLAVIMYRALTGRRPFPGREVSAVFVQICADPVPPPTEVNPELPTSLDRFFLRALDRDLDWRFESARAFATAFEIAVRDGQEGEPSIRHTTTVDADGLTVTQNGEGPPTARTAVGDVPLDVPLDEAQPPSRPLSELRTVDHPSETSPDLARLVANLLVLAALVGLVVWFIGPERLDALGRAFDKTVERLHQLGDE